MALNAGAVVAQFKSDIAGMQKGISSIKSEVNSLKKGFSNAGSQMASAGNTIIRYGALAGAAMAGLAGYAIKTAGDLEQQRMAFKTLLGSVEEADAAIEMIKKDAATTPFELTGLIEANKLLTAVTKEAPRSEAMLLNVGKALAAVGKGQAEMDRIIVNLQQIGAVGKASMLDIKQFAFAGIPIFEMLTETTGKSGEALSDLISEGGVTFELLEKMFAKYGEEGGRFANSFADQAGTFNQTWSNLKDSLVIFGSEFVKQTGLFDLAKNALSGLVAWIDANKDSIVAWAKETGKTIAEFSKKVAKFMKPIIEWFKKFFSEAENRKAVIIAFLVGIAALVIAAAVAFIAAHAIIFGIVAGIMLIVGTFVKFWDDVWGFITRKTQEQLDMIKSYINGFVSFWSSVGQAIWAVIVAIGGFFQALYERFIKPPIDAVVAFLTALGQVFSWIWENLVFPIMYLAFAVISRILYEIYKVFETVFKWIWENAIEPVLTVVWGGIKTVFEAIAGFLGIVWEGIKFATNAAWQLVKQYILDPIFQASEGTMSLFEKLTTWIQEKWTALKDWFIGMVATIYNAIVEPFQKAADKIKEIAEKIKEYADKINPFHKESPSLVENVEKGVGKIISQYQSLVDSLSNMNFRGQVMQMAGGVGEGKSGATINQYINAELGDGLDIDTLAERLAFKFRSQL